MKKIGLFCLCLASLSLVGCFHVPSQDWLPSRNKIDTGNIEKNDDVQNAMDSVVDGIDMISNQRSEIKNKNNSGELEELNETNDETQDSIEVGNMDGIEDIVAEK